MCQHVWFWDQSEYDNPLWYIFNWGGPGPDSGYMVCRCEVPKWEDMPICRLDTCWDNGGHHPDEIGFYKKHLPGFVDNSGVMCSEE